MRVLTIWMAGMNSHALDRLKALSENGIEVGLLCDPRWPEAGVELTKRKVDLPFDVFTRRTMLSGRGPFYIFVPGVSKAVKEFQPDLIHVREEMYTVFAGQFLAERAMRFPGIPFVFESWQNIRKVYPAPARWFESTGYRKSSGAIAGTPPVEDVLRSGGYKGPLAVIPLGGIATDVYQPKGRDLRALLPKGLLIGYVGRLVKEKGVDLLLEAVAQVSSPVTAVIAGDGPGRDRLESMAKELQVNASFLGPVNQESMPSLLRSLDVLVLPSRTTNRWKEQWGRVLTEAMACGTPVVGSSSGEIPYVIGDSGRVFSEGSASDLARILDEILSSKDLREQMAVTGVARATEFSWSRHADKTLAFFEEVLAGVH